VATPEGDYSEELKALRRALGQLGAVVDLLVGMSVPDEADDSDEGREAQAVYKHMHELLRESQISLDKFDNLTSR
jgi:hypothetical protein